MFQASCDIVSSIFTMPDPLSAALITRVRSAASLCSVFSSALVGFLLKGLGSRSLICYFALFRYASIARLATGGIHADFLWKGCGTEGGEFLKKCFSLFDLSNQGEGKQQHQQDRRQVIVHAHAPFWASG